MNFTGLRHINWGSLAWLVHNGALIDQIAAASAALANVDYSHLPHVNFSKLPKVTWGNLSGVPKSWICLGSQGLRHPECSDHGSGLSFLAGIGHAAASLGDLGYC
ncbi:MAG TPA: hypothetical protein VLM11_11200 [Streptosporangiaceae bacterium]|nr:hypothetical protein [Streptosporangiaceae bacterium]